MSTARHARLGVCFAALALASVCFAEPPRLDGVLNEWSVADELPASAGGASGAFTVGSVSARSEGSRLYLRFDTGIVANLQAGSGSQGTLILDIRRTDPSEQQALAVDFRSRTLYANGNPGSVVGWDDAGLFVQPTFAASEYEMVIDLGVVGLGEGDTIRLTFGAGGIGESAAEFTLADPPAPAPERSFERPAATRVRVASLNTLQTGLFDTQQEDALARLIDGVDAEVYCFQEEYDSSQSQIKTLLESIDPLDDGAPWNVHKVNDCVVASVFPLTPMVSANSKYAGAGLDLGDDRRVIIFSIHPKCCGYIGSSEDNQRINETNAMIGSLEDIRAGAAGASLLPFADAPACFIGDWNLVGSRTPLTIVEDPAGPDQRDVLPGPLKGRTLSTWRGNSTGAGSFMPGRLDLLTVQRDALAVMNAFTLDSALLSPTDLASLGLQASDSAASDHLMLVADLAFPGDLCGGDIDSNGVVNVLDFAVLAGSFTQGPGVTRSEGDLTGDGFVDVFDFAELAGAFGQACP